MGIVKNTIVSLTSSLLIGAASVIGMMAGFTIWENGLGDKVAEKTRKVFK